jgi:hypothetical protein
VPHHPTPLIERMTPEAYASMRRYLLAGVRRQFPGRKVRIERIEAAAESLTAD